MVARAAVEAAAVEAAGSPMLYNNDRVCDESCLAGLIL